MNKNIFSSKTLAGLLFYQIINFWHYYLLGLGTLVITHYSGSLIPFLAKDLIEQLSGVDKGITISSFILPILGLVIFRTLSRVLFFHPARIMQGRLMNTMVEKMENSFFQRFSSKYHPGQILQTLNSDTAQVRALGGFVFLQIFNISIATIIFIPKLASFSSSLLWAITPLVFSVVLVSIIITKNVPIFELIEKEWDYLQNTLIESYKGRDTIQNFGKESSFISNFLGGISREADLSIITANRISYLRPIVNLGMGISLAMSAYIIKRDDLGVSSLALFSGFLFLFFEPMMFLTWVGIIITRTRVCWRRLTEFYSTVNTVHPLEKIIDGLDLNLLSQQVPLWKRISTLNIANTEKYCIVGKTGSGKSVFLERLALIMKTKNESISFVTQSPYLFNDTIEKNIFFSLDANLEKKKFGLKLLKLFELDNLARSDEDLLQLKVGEFGKRLSGGQIKRLAIIRSLLSDADTYIWDDPFSSIDLLMEGRIFKELITLLEGKRFIFSTHRFSTVRRASRIFYIEKNVGVLLSAGNEALTEKSGVLYEHFKEQMV